MQLENSFELDAPANVAYELLLDAYRVVGCMPGAELTGQPDSDTFSGTVRVKIGPVTARYGGTGRITARDLEQLCATLEAQGRDTAAGEARAFVRLSVAALAPGRSRVELNTDLAISGRAAQFGSSVITQVSRQLVGQFADNLAALLEATSLPTPAAATEAAAAAPAAADRLGNPAPTPAGEPPARPAAVAPPASEQAVRVSIFAALRGALLEWWRSRRARRTAVGQGR